LTNFKFSTLCPKIKNRQFKRWKLDKSILEIQGAIGLILNEIYIYIPDAMGMV
jgi:hypothetical protein